ncbi:MAG: tetratricopeptide repeat protein [Gammaproteobacteria bacterium]|nr:tetratricopeptide repeat protein [Gammaproteobacteria bacterium]
MRPTGLAPTNDDATTTQSSEMVTEQEQVEALQRWWKENGKSVILALVIGFGGLGGYSWWRSSTQQHAEGVSVAYNELVDAVDEGKLEEVLSRTDTLISQDPDSAYAGLAALQAAASAHRDGDLPAARRLLLWASEHAEQNFMRSLARLRLARLMLDEQQYDDALRELDQIDVPALSSLSQELRGDIQLARSKPAEARDTFSSLLQQEVDEADRIRLQQKLDMAMSLSDAR